MEVEVPRRLIVVLAVVAVASAAAGLLHDFDAFLIEVTASVSGFCVAVLIGARLLRASTSLARRERFRDELDALDAAINDTAAHELIEGTPAELRALLSPLEPALFLMPPVGFESSTRHSTRTHSVDP